MQRFLEALRVQRWDDHRYYHHSRVNQSLHLVSAVSFLAAYAMMFGDPAMAALIGWLVAMTSRQIGHFFFEPKDYDVVNHATHEHKEEIKVGYNLRRKVGLMTIWALSPLPLYFDPTFFGIFTPHASTMEFVRHVAQIWLAIGIGGLLFRTVQLFFIKDVQTGLVWAAKILTRSTTSSSTTRPRCSCCAANGSIRITPRATSGSPTTPQRLHTRADSCRKALEQFLVGLIHHPTRVTRGLDPRVHHLRRNFSRRRWIAGSSPAMTTRYRIKTGGK